MNRPAAEIRRPAFTLIEVVTTLTLGSLMAILAVGLVHRTFEVHTTSKARVESYQRLDELGHQFRRDVWSSNRVEVIDETTFVLWIEGQSSLASTDHRVTYKIGDEQLMRTYNASLDADDQGLDDNIHRESYRLLPDASPMADKSEGSGTSKAAFEKSGSKLVLKIFQATDESDKATSVNQVPMATRRVFEATLGRWSVSDSAVGNDSSRSQESP